MKGYAKIIDENKYDAPKTSRFSKADKNFLNEFIKKTVSVTPTSQILNSNR